MFFLALLELQAVKEASTDSSPIQGNHLIPVYKKALL